jgi:hypothetical protein
MMRASGKEIEKMVDGGEKGEGGGVVSGKESKS